MAVFLRALLIFCLLTMASVVTGWAQFAAPPQAAVGYNTRTFGPDLVLGKNWLVTPGANVTHTTSTSITCAGAGRANHWNDHASAATCGPVPPQAAAVGYNTCTYGPNVTLGQNWWPESGANVVQNADGSVTDIGGKPNHWNSHVKSVHGSTGDYSGTLKGGAFGGGGYFEATFSWANPPTAGYQNVDGWPAWWAWGVEEKDFDGIGSLPVVVEYDSYEAMEIANDSQYNAAYIVWGCGGQCGTRGGWVKGGDQGRTYAPPGTDVTKPHKVGWLWVPATDTSPGYIKNYYDGVQIGSTYFWNKYSGKPGISMIDLQHFYLIFGTGTKNPMTVYKVEVWQKDSSHNLVGTTKK